MNLTENNVNNVFEDCLHTYDDLNELDKSEIAARTTSIEGITAKVDFNTERLQRHKDDIKSMLSELPDQFMHANGGGYTFLAASEDKNGNRWTDLQKTMERLFILGMAVKYVRYCFPRDFWRALPGGVPYYSVSFDCFQTKSG